ncbi:MAG: type II toxin-antitoxin system RelE/ParE family toxin [Pseudorhodoplanes sp.]|nr:type II toxin-antitoxin system RelE/ParE family toxin [Pseudorhodoplanes sp.]
MRLRYKRRAIQHLRSIFSFIEQDNPRAASEVVARIERAVERLTVAPHSARPGPGPGTRLIAGPGLPCIVVYRVRGEAVQITAILHTARNQGF